MIRASPQPIEYWHGQRRAKVPDLALAVVVEIGRALPEVARERERGQALKFRRAHIEPGLLQAFLAAQPVCALFKGGAGVGQARQAGIHARERKIRQLQRRGGIEVEESLEDQFALHDRGHLLQSRLLGLRQLRLGARHVDLRGEPGDQLIFRQIEQGAGARDVRVEHVQSPQITQVAEIRLRHAGERRLQHDAHINLRRLRPDAQRLPGREQLRIEQGVGAVEAGVVAVRRARLTERAGRAEDV